MNENEVKQWKEQAEKMRKGEAYYFYPWWQLIHFWDVVNKLLGLLLTLSNLFPVGSRLRAPRVTAEAGEEGARVRCQDPGEGGHDADAQQDEGEAGEGEQRAQNGQTAAVRTHRPATWTQHSMLTLTPRIIRSTGDSGSRKYSSVNAYGPMKSFWSWKSF